MPCPNASGKAPPTKEIRVPPAPGFRTAGLRPAPFSVNNNPTRQTPQPIESAAALPYRRRPAGSFDFAVPSDI